MLLAPFSSPRPAPNSAEAVNQVWSMEDVGPSRRSLTFVEWLTELQDVDELSVEAGSHLNTHATQEESVTYKSQVLSCTPVRCRPPRGGRGPGQVHQQCGRIPPRRRGSCTLQRLPAMASRQTATTPSYVTIGRRSYAEMAARGPCSHVLPSTRVASCLMKTHLSRSRLEIDWLALA